MKFLIASDLHGSEFYTSLLLERFKEEGAELLVLLGDLYYHGPRNPLPKGYDPKAVAEKLNSIADKLIVVKGNCDSDVDAMISSFEFVSQAVLSDAGKRIFVQHGDRFDRDHLPKNCGDAFIYGHFHTGFIERIGNVLVANCGSVSLPKNETAHSYIVLENGVVTLKDISGSVIDHKKI